MIEKNNKKLGDVCLKTFVEKPFAKSLALIKEGMELAYYTDYAVAIGQGEQLYAKAGTKEGQLFDLASISKIMVTTMLALKLIEQGRLGLFDSLSLFYENVYDKGDITIRHLMTHSSGMPPHIMLEDFTTPECAVDYILKQPLDYPTGSEVAYSCMGYIVLGDIIAKIMKKPLDVLAKEYVFEPLQMKTACYNPQGATAGNRFEPSFTADGFKLSVDDENARFLGGVSGNAGVFGSLDDCIHYASMLSQGGRFQDKAFLTKPTFKNMIYDYTPSYSEHRGLGLILKDKALSAAGDLFSDGSYGHTGYTGTSIYVDKKTRLYVVFLTDAVHKCFHNKPSFLRFRRLLHNRILSEFYSAMEQ